MKNQPTGIVYTTIAHDGEVLVEQINRSPQFAHNGNFMQVIHILLPKLPKEGRSTFHYDRFGNSLLDTDLQNVRYIRYEQWQYYVYRNVLPLGAYSSCFSVLAGS